MTLFFPASSAWHGYRATSDPVVVAALAPFRGLAPVWVVTSGEAGMRAQALGLAEALGAPYTEWAFALAASWRPLPPMLARAAWEVSNWLQDIVARAASPIRFLYHPSHAKCSYQNQLLWHLPDPHSERADASLASHPTNTPSAPTPEKPPCADPPPLWWHRLTARLVAPPLAALPADPTALALPPLTPVDPHTPPAPPRLIVATGRRAIAPALWLKAHAPSHPAVLYVQDPRTQHAAFDRLFVPAHDPARGPNIVVTPLALHRVTPTRLATAAAVWQPRWAPYPKPWWGLIVGGPSRSVAWDEATARAAIGAWLDAARESGATLFATTARRTPATLTAWLTQTLAERLPASPLPYTGSGENPYLAILALTEARAITSDSVSMLSESVAAPGRSYRLEVGRYRPRLARFHAVWEEGPASLST